MTLRNAKPPTCPIHGTPTKRSACLECNSAYMRGYLRQRRRNEPNLTIWERARRRARRRGVLFTLSRERIVIPNTCPALGIPLAVKTARSDNSPSLDRIKPTAGYTDVNVRVISDRANRLKADLDLQQLRARARQGRPDLRRDYGMIADYVEREALLAEVRSKAAMGGAMGKEWEKIVQFLDRAFRKGMH